ncbi:MAG: hypothetical protein LIO87_06645 [Eubacterium sp.]|nr:hypothetical protein [Eubacterium sp.]
MKLKQIISAALITALLPLGTGTAVFGEETSAKKVPSVGETKTEFTQNGDLIIADDGINDNGLLKQAYPKLRSSALTSYNSDPDSLKYITEPKDQAHMGSCWAFSSASCIETLLMKQDGIETTSDSKYDFSVLHAVLAVSNSFLLENEYGFANLNHSGGSQDLYTMYITRAKGTNLFNGPVKESSMTYTDDEDEIAKITADDMENAEYVGYIPGSYSYIDLSGGELSYEETVNRNAIIKDLVNAYGSVSISIDCGEAIEDNFENFEITDDYTLFYDPEYKVPDHAVTIVGYDDSFDADVFGDAFGKTPSMDGAFLVKNSWGTDWGKNNGFFYLSYDSYIADINAFGNLISMDTYDYEYDYTPFGYVGGVHTYEYQDDETDETTGYGGVFANNFEKQTENPEELTAVSVFVYSADTDIQIYVDTDDSDGEDDLDGLNNDLQLLSFKEPSDSMAYSLYDEGTTINVPYMGNYIFELDEPVALDGDFTVIVEAVSSTNIPVAYECTTASKESLLWLNHKYIGKSYLAVDVDGEFTGFCDYMKADDSEAKEGDYEYDLMIKAYTAEIPPVNVTVDGISYEGDYGTALSEVLSANNITDTVYEETAENSYEPADTSAELTEDITLYTGSYIHAPAIEMNNYQTSDDGYIRFVGEITDEFDDAVEAVIALGFVYSADGGDTETTIVCDSDLYQSLGDYTAPDNTYLFKSGELTAADYIVSAYVSYVITGETDAVTVYTEEKTISTTSALND